jgi:hypothetical protein
MENVVILILAECHLSELNVVILIITELSVVILSVTLFRVSLSLVLLTGSYAECRLFIVMQSGAIPSVSFLLPLFRVSLGRLSWHQLLTKVYEPQFLE